MVEASTTNSKYSDLREFIKYLSWPIATLLMLLLLASVAAVVHDVFA